MTKTNLIIIGGGPGGYQSAAYAAKQGLSVRLFEKDTLGGTCLNRGCIPTKTYCHAAEVISSARSAEAWGINGLHYDFDFARLVDYKNKVVSQLVSGIETLMKAGNVDVVHGEASFVDAHTVECNGEHYEADNIIIATGSSAKMPPIEGLKESDKVVSSTELLQMTELPKRLCIVGAGVIGMEFASALSTFGSEVTLVEFMKECLPVVDSDIAKRLRKQMEKRGVKFYLQSAVKRISDGTVFFERKGKEESVEADCILVATGRKANTEGLNLEGVGVSLSKRGMIEVDMNMLTSVPGIYAIGDVNGRQMLAHAAEYQGMKAVNAILGKDDSINLDVMPYAVFTNPEVAGVGFTEDQLKVEGREFKTGKAFYRANGKAVSMGETDGLVKVLTDADGTIIGCHVMGPHAADMAQEMAVAMNTKMNSKQFHDIVHIHPTLSELLHDATA